MDRPFRDAGDFLTTYSRRLVELCQARGGELRLRRLGRVLLSRDGADVVTDWVSEGCEDQHTDADRKTRHGREEETEWDGEASDALDASADMDADVEADADTDAEASPHSRSTASLVVPIVYAEARIGALRLTFDEAPAPDVPSHIGDYARQVAFMAKRFEVAEWARRRLGRPLLLVGMSEAIRNLEVFVEKAAQSDLPSLLHGEFGTETPYLAAAIHCCGPRRDRAFVQVDCAQPPGLPEQWFRQAEGGSLFLSDVDALSPTLQRQLPRHMQSRLGQWLDVSGTARVRVIASTSADLRRLVDDQAFSRQLLAELDFLPVTVPPLRERIGDIEPIVVAALEGHGYVAEEKISPDMLELCRAYAWPENAFEVERVVARLAVMTGRAPIRAEDVRMHFPALYPRPDARRTPTPAFAPVACATVPERETELKAEVETGDAADVWVRHALARDAKALAPLHPGLRRALLYLVDHYPEPIRLSVLARRVNVSQSHLSFLFRNSLQTSCKAMLARIRVENAKTLLTENAHQPITDVALQVGFGDLSHFERYFRRQVGRTPREFRRAAGA